MTLGSGPYRDARAEYKRIRALRRVSPIAAHLRERRFELGLTQRRLSELSGIQQADISRIERGETQPTTVTAKRLADALGVDFGFYETDTTDKVVAIEPASVKAA
jgi:transcriptional regulator with XRE-family HTH domain